LLIPRKPVVYTYVGHVLQNLNYFPLPVALSSYSSWPEGGLWLFYVLVGGLVNGFERVVEHRGVDMVDKS
jgi:hypothetical protein